MAARTDLPRLDAPDDDPHLWLEDVDGERATTWVDAQSAATLARFGGPCYEADRAALRQLFDRPDRIPHVVRRGAHVYNFWQDAAQPRGLWRRTTLDSYRTTTPVWDVLLDLDALAREEGEDWVWRGATGEPVEHRRAILRLSRGGGDAVVLREFDLETRRFVPDGFVLPEAKGGIAWLDPDTLLLSSAFGGPDMATTSGYARTVRLWRRDSDPSRAELLFETIATDMSAWGSVDRTASAPRLWFMSKPGFFDTVAWLGDRGGPRHRVELPTDAAWNVHDDMLVVKPRTAWAVAGRAFEPGQVLGLSLAQFLGGDRAFTVLFEPGPRRSLDTFFFARDRLVLSILDDLAPRFELRTFKAGVWRRHALDMLPRSGVVSLWRLDAHARDSDGTLVVGLQDPVTPLTTMLFDVSEPDRIAMPALLKSASPGFDAAGLVVTRHEALSSDGERIPYTQTGPVGLTGEAPLHLYGYGGFEISLLPSYNASLGRMWLMHGGTGVVANIRGGGEFGTWWHEAGRREGKRLAHDDFAAVAADLVRRGVTRAGRIAAEGGSNGGLLIANMLTRYPERFGALFCTIPLIDMRRYAALLAGASWVAEYGDPDVPDDWSFLGPMSAYHAAEPGRPYPPILLATARRDDRVHPAHARKMAAKLQAMGYEAHLYEPGAGGHGYGKDNAERAAFTALGFAFMRDAIGWTG